MKKIATSKVYVLHKELIHYAMQLTNSRYNLSCELVQNVWQKVYSKVPAEIPDIAYLKAMLKNEYIDHFREKQIREKKLVEYITKCKMDEEYDSTVDKQYKQIKCEAQKHPKGWILLELHDRDCTLKELSQVLNINYPKLRKQISRIQKDIRVKLKTQQRQYKISGGGVNLKTLPDECLNGIMSQF